MEQEFKSIFTTGEFAKEFGIKKDTLFYYDKIGLFKPAGIHENGYRYYTYNQFDTFSAIHSLRLANVSIETLKSYFLTPSLPALDTLAHQQLHAIDEQIQQLNETKYFLEQVTKTIAEISQISFETIIYQTLPDIPVIYSEESLSSELSDEEFGQVYEFFMKQLGIKVCATIGTVFSLRSSAFENEGDRYRMFYRAQQSNDVIPAGLYAVYYHQGMLDDFQRIHQSMKTSIEQACYTVDGPLYEEYLLHALSPGKEAEHVTKFFMKVKKYI